MTALAVPEGSDYEEPPVVMREERYVDARELAARMGVSVRTVNRLTAAGMPSETWGMVRTRRYLPSQAIAWAHSRGGYRRIDRNNDHVRRMTTAERHREE